MSAVVRWSESLFRGPVVLMMRDPIGDQPTLPFTITFGVVFYVRLSSLSQQMTKTIVCVAAKLRTCHLSRPRFVIYFAAAPRPSPVVSISLPLFHRAGQAGGGRQRRGRGGGRMRGHAPGNSWCDRRGAHPQSGHERGAGAGAISRALVFSITARARQGFAPEK